MTKHSSPADEDPPDDAGGEPGQSGSSAGSDQLVSARDVLGAVLEVRRRGITPLMRELEGSEPDLCEYFLVLPAEA